MLKDIDFYELPKRPPRFYTRTERQFTGAARWRAQVCYGMDSFAAGAWVEPDTEEQAEIDAHVLLHLVQLRSA